MIFNATNTNSPLIPKTNKLFINGEFLRSESGRSEPVHMFQSPKLHSYVCRASRKDLRSAVTAAQGGFQSWQKKTAYNRGQILYRTAEMLSSRRLDLEAQLQNLLGIQESQAQEQISKSLETLLYYAGFADKLNQVLGSINPVSGPYHNFTALEPMGVVGIVYDQDFNLNLFFRQIASTLCAGNSLVMILDKPGSALLSDLAEIFKTSDLPNGVINLLSGSVKELSAPLASHMEVQALIVASADKVCLSQMQKFAVDNMKRVVNWDFSKLSVKPLSALSEAKTVWHPVGV